MSNVEVVPVIQFYADVGGKALDDGFVYIGTSGLDPVANPISVFWDEALTIPAPNPVRTRNGHPDRSGTPSRFFVNADSYSFAVKNKNGTTVYTALDSLSASDIERRLRNTTDPAKGAGIIGWDRAPLSASLTTVHQMLDAQPVNLWEFADLVVTKPTPSNPETWDWTPALQAAVDSDRPVYIPSGVFKLFTPVFVSTGTVIYGHQGQGAGFIAGTTLAPTTSAFLSSDFTAQQVYFRMSDLQFSGGTTQVDLGLFHEVDVTDCSFFNPSVGAFVLVRGEKVRFERIRIDPRSPGIFGMSLGRWEESTFGGYNDAFFAPDGAFIDRVTFKDIHMQSGGGGYFAYGLKSNILSSATFMNFLVHGANNNGEVSVLFIRTRIQSSTFTSFVMDNFGGVGTPSPAVLDLAFVKGCTLANVSPSFAGNNNYAIGMRMTNADNTVLLGCHADGNNTTQFGFTTGTVGGQTLTMIGCRGAFFHNSVNALVRAQVVQIGCNFTNNNGGSDNMNFNDANIMANLMADTAGSVAATSQWGAIFANGGGNSRTPFYVKKETPWFQGLLSFRNAFGEGTPQTVIVNITNNVTPEGVVTANPGSLYLFYNATTSGKLYVKESGSGNTGWILK